MDVDDDGSLFGSPSPPPSDVRARSPSPMLALPGVDTNDVVHLPGVNVPSIDADAPSISENVGTIAPSGSQNYSERSVNSLALSSSRPLSAEPTLRPPAISAAPSQQGERPKRRRAPRVQRKRKRGPLSPDAETCVIVQQPLLPSNPAQSVPPNFLRNMSSLLGAAGIVADIRPRSSPGPPPGSSSVNPFVIDEHGPESASAPIRSKPPSVPITNSESSLTSLTPAVRAHVLQLLRKNPQFKDVVKKLKAYNSRTAFSASDWAKQPARKKRLLRRIPAGAQYWDQPFPFSPGEGPSDLLSDPDAYWRKRVGRSLVSELVQIFRRAVSEALAFHRHHETGQQSAVTTSVSATLPSDYRLSSMTPTPSLSPSTPYIATPFRLMYRASSEQPPASFYAAGANRSPLIHASEFPRSSSYPGTPGATAVSSPNASAEMAGTCMDGLGFDMNSLENWMRMLEETSTTDSSGTVTPDVANTSTLEGLFDPLKDWSFLEALSSENTTAHNEKSVADNTTAPFSFEMFFSDPDAAMLLPQAQAGLSDVSSNPVSQSIFSYDHSFQLCETATHLTADIPELAAKKASLATFELPPSAEAGTWDKDVGVVQTDGFGLAGLAVVSDPVIPAVVRSQLDAQCATSTTTNTEFCDRQATDFSHVVFPDKTVSNDSTTAASISNPPSAMPSTLAADIASESHSNHSFDVNTLGVNGAETAGTGVCHPVTEVARPYEATAPIMTHAAPVDTASACPLSSALDSHRVSRESAFYPRPDNIPTSTSTSGQSSGPQFGGLLAPTAMTTANPFTITVTPARNSATNGSSGVTTPARSAIPRDKATIIAAVRRRREELEQELRSTKMRLWETTVESATLSLVARSCRSNTTGSAFGGAKREHSPA